jgi:hypothetical protein
MVASVNGSLGRELDAEGSCTNWLRWHGNLFQYEWWSGERRRFDGAEALGEEQGFMHHGFTVVALSTAGERAVANLRSLAVQFGRPACPGRLAPSGVSEDPSPNLCAHAVSPGFVEHVVPKTVEGLQSLVERAGVSDGHATSIGVCGAVIRSVHDEQREPKPTELLGEAVDASDDIAQQARAEASVVDERVVAVGGDRSWVLHHHVGLDVEYR